MKRVLVDVAWNEEQGSFWPCEPGSNPPKWIMNFDGLYYGDKDNRKDDTLEAGKTLNADRTPKKTARVKAFITVR